MMGSNDAEGDKELDHYEESAHKIISPGSGSMLAPYTSIIVELAKSLIPLNSASTTDMSEGSGEGENMVEARPKAPTGPQLLLMEAVSLTLTKFMCISEDFCKDNLSDFYSQL